MDFSDDLITTLDSTLNLAIGLEKVSSMLFPKRISLKGRKRILNINKEIKDLSILSNTKPRRIVEEKPSTSIKRPPKQKKEIVFDSTGKAVKRKLSLSLNEVNQRVIRSRAGKKSLGDYITEEAQSSPITKELSTLHTFANCSSPSRFFHSRPTEEKPSPYISLTNGRIEDPITLPTFTEFLEGSGGGNVVRKGAEDLKYRIQKATDQIDRLNDALDQKLISLKKQASPMVYHKRGSMLVESKSYKRDSTVGQTNNQGDLRSIMNQYYKMPKYYSTPKASKERTLSTPNSLQVTLNTDPEESLGDTIKSFYKSKAVENRKLTDILDKIAVERPYYMQKKIELIQKDHEKFKNRLHSIEKFNGFRGRVEASKRKKQYRNYEQGLMYLEILDEFKRKKYEPSDCELLVLGIWKRLVESGWPITSLEFSEILSTLTHEEIERKEVKNLLDKLSAIC